MVFWALLLSAIFLVLGLSIGWTLWGEEIKKSKEKINELNKSYTVLKINTEKKSVAPQNTPLAEDVCKQKTEEIKTLRLRFKELQSSYTQKETLIKSINEELNGLKNYRSRFNTLENEFKQKIAGLRADQSEIDTLYKEIDSLKEFKTQYKAISNLYVDKEYAFKLKCEELDLLRPAYEELRQLLHNAKAEVEIGSQSLKTLNMLKEELYKLRNTSALKDFELDYILKEYQSIESLYTKLITDFEEKRATVDVLTEQLKEMANLGNEYQFLKERHEKQREDFVLVAKAYNSLQNQYFDRLAEFNKQTETVESLQTELESLKEFKKQNLYNQQLSEQKEAYIQKLNKEIASLSLIETRYNTLEQQFLQFAQSPRVFNSNNQASNYLYNMSEAERLSFFGEGGHIHNVLSKNQEGEEEINFDEINKPINLDLINLLKTQSLYQPFKLGDRFDPINSDSSEGKQKVLMLGWEFPPVINGGLGIACHGLSKALAKYVDLCLILPKVENSFSVDQIELLGLNHFDFEDLLGNEDAALDFLQQYSVAIGMNPYQDSLLSGKKHKDLSMKGLFQLLSTGDLYGEEVIDKVVLFSKCVFSIAKKQDFDVIYAHDWMTYLAGIYLKEQTGKPLVLHVHATQFDRAGAEQGGWIYELEKEAFQKADLIIPVSHYTAGIIKEYYGVWEDKVFPVHNGVLDVAVFEKEKNFKEKLVLFLGRITDQKGPEVFLDVAMKVYESYENVRFVVAGTGDKMKKMIEGGAYRNIGHRLHFTGFLPKEKVHDILAMSDVYCMPSVSEPFGLSALEAAQFDVPIVISKQSGAAEVMESALTADFWDVDLMAKHIVDLLEDDKMAQQMVAKGKSDLKNLTWEKSAEKIARLFETKIEAVVQHQ